MRQLLATMILGGVLAVTAATAFAESNSADQNVAPFAPVIVRSMSDTASTAGTDTQLTLSQEYRLDNIKQ